MSSKKLAGELLAFWHHIMRGGGGRRVFAELSELGLNITHLKTLHVLNDCEGELSVKEIGEQLGMSLPNTSRTADVLAQRDLVERREDPADRRQKLIAITPAGRRALDRIEAARLEGLQAFADSLTPEQRGTLFEALAGLPHRSA